jgi:hypothetical protein
VRKQILQLLSINSRGIVRRLPLLVWSVFLVLGLAACAEESKTAAMKKPARRETIQDEAKVPPYTLPDPLLCRDGTRVTDAKTWREKRRPELLKLFEGEVYGKTLVGRPESLKFVVREEKKDACRGKATRLRVGVLFEGREDGRQMELLIYLPNSAKGPLPVFFGLNFDGNYVVTDDADMPVPKHFVHGLFNNQAESNVATEAGRGSHKSMWQCDYLLEKGYGLVTACYCEIEPDEREHVKDGPRGLGPEIGPGDWGMMGSWAWGISRGMDYLETNARIDARRVALVGFSRIGKAALWAGAQDERFALVVSNCSGAGGAALSKRIFGETVADSTEEWFCERFKQYANNEEAMPVDQHELLALLAPRPLLVTSATEDLWADPKGEFLSVVAADPVYRLLGTDGIRQKDWPEAGKLVESTLGYFLRMGGHDVTFEDWKVMVAFADKFLPK